MDRKEDEDDHLQAGLEGRDLKDLEVTPDVLHSTSLRGWEEDRHDYFMKQLLNY